MFDYSTTDTLQQMTSLPLAMLVWIRLLAFINITSLFWLKRPQGRWVLGALLFICAINLPMLIGGTGLGKILGVPHVLAWMPLIMYLAHQFRTGEIQIKSVFGMWCLLVITVNLISVVFDSRDAVQYLLGDRSPMVIDVSAGLPYASLTAIAMLWTATLVYAFRPSLFIKNRVKNT